MRALPLSHTTDTQRARHAANASAAQQPDPHTECDVLWTDSSASQSMRALFAMTSTTPPLVVGYGFSRI